MKLQSFNLNANRKTFFDQCNRFICSHDLCFHPVPFTYPDINSSREKIAAAISDFKTWEKWNQFISRSGLKNKSISSPSFGKNAFLVSDQFKVVITAYMPDTVKTYWQHGRRGFEGVFHLVPNQPDNTTVQWYFDFSFKWYPWEKLGSMFYDKQIGPVMEESLLNLKRLVENNH